MSVRTQIFAQVRDGPAGELCGVAITIDTSGDADKPAFREPLFTIINDAIDTVCRERTSSFVKVHSHHLTRPRLPDRGIRPQETP